MKFLKSLLMGTGAVVLAGLVLALLAPQAVHAVVATAVQVVNTSASPAITEDTSHQASQIVTILCGLAAPDVISCVQVLPNGGYGELHGQRGGYVVPANQSFILKSIDTYSFPGVPPPSFLQILLLNPQGGDSQAEIVPTSINGQISFASGIAVGPGMELIPLAGGVDGNVTLHGYLTPN